MGNKHTVQSKLEHHIGAENGKPAKVLAAELGIPVRELRALITELRLDGIAVCGHPRTGYFIAANDREVEDTCKFLRSRAMHSLALEAALRKLTIPDLIGQGRLRT